jgi:hypothetical protein
MTFNSRGQAEPSAPATAHRVLPTGNTKGAHVRNFAGEDLGKVDELVVDFDSGRIAYVIVAVGGFLGIGEKLHAVPWDLFTVRMDDHEFLVDVDKQMLLDAPGFERGQWPDMGDARWGDGIRSHFSQKPYWNSDITDAADYTGDDRYDKPDR